MTNAYNDREQLLGKSYLGESDMILRIHMSFDEFHFDGFELAANIVHRSILFKYQVHK